MEELSYVPTKHLVACVPVRFYFSHTAHFHLDGRWHFLFSHRCYEIFMFFFQGNSSPLFSITRSSSFYVINVSVNVKNIVQKNSIFTLMCLWCGRTDGRTDGRAVGRTYGQVTTKLSRMHKIDDEIFLPMVLRAR